MCVPQQTVRYLQLEHIFAYLNAAEECDPARDRYESVGNAQKSHDKFQRMGYGLSAVLTEKTDKEKNFIFKT